MYPFVAHALKCLMKPFCSLSSKVTFTHSVFPFQGSTLPGSGNTMESKNRCLHYWSLQAIVQSVISDSLQTRGLQHARLPCPSPTPGACSNSSSLNWWCKPTILSSVIPFSSCLPSFPASGSFLMSQFFASGGQSIGSLASASVLPMTIQGWFPLGLTGLVSLKSKGLSRLEKP